MEGGVFGIWAPNSDSFSALSTKKAVGSTPFIIHYTLAGGSYVGTFYHLSQALIYIWCFAL